MLTQKRCQSRAKVKAEAELKTLVGFKVMIEFLFSTEQKTNRQNPLEMRCRGSSRRGAAAAVVVQLRWLHCAACLAKVHLQLGQLSRN